MGVTVTWRGIYPAVTSQFLSDFSLDLSATLCMATNLVRDGVHGLVVLGTCGEAACLTRDEKLDLVATALEAAAARVPVISGVAEASTADAVAYARACEALGADGLMLMPPRAPSPGLRQAKQHIRATAEAVSIPVAVCNDPAASGMDLGPDCLAELARVPNIQAVNECSREPGRITQLVDLGERAPAVLSGVDELAPEFMRLGCGGWVSACANVFPRETVALYEMLRSGETGHAADLYRWMMPILHMNRHPRQVQMIKLSEQIVGRGSEIMRPPGLPLAGPERTHTICTIEKALATRPAI